MKWERVSPYFNDKCIVLRPNVVQRWNSDKMVVTAVLSPGPYLFFEFFVVTIRWVILDNNRYLENRIDGPSYSRFVLSETELKEFCLVDDPKLIDTQFWGHPRDLIWKVLDHQLHQEFACTSFTDVRLGMDHLIPWLLEHRSVDMAIKMAQALELADAALQTIEKLGILAE